MVSPQAIEELERVFKRRGTRKIIREGDFVPAAVMMILKGIGEDGYSMLFIKRPENSADTFSGHMAFPGGRMKEGDGNKLETAIRETLEETGIDLKKNGRILGELDDFNPISPRANHYIVTPYVSLLTRDAKIIPNDKEVDEVVWIPLSHFKDRRNLEVRMVERKNLRIEDFVFRYQNYVIWGLTGRILYEFLSLAGHLF